MEEDTKVKKFIFWLTMNQSNIIFMLIVILFIFLFPDPTRWIILTLAASIYIGVKYSYKEFAKNLLIIIIPVSIVISLLKTFFGITGILIPEILILGSTGCVGYWRKNRLKN